MIALVGGDPYIRSAVIRKRESLETGLRSLQAYMWVLVRD